MNEQPTTEPDECTLLMNRILRECVIECHLEYARELLRDLYRAAREKDLEGMVRT